MLRIENPRRRHFAFPQVNVQRRRYYRASATAAGIGRLGEANSSYPKWSAFAWVSLVSNQATHKPRRELAYMPLRGR